MATVKDKSGNSPYLDPHIPGDMRVVGLTQAEYDNLPSYDSNTLYVIIPET